MSTVKKALTLRWWGDTYEHQIGAALVLFASLFALSCIALSVACGWAATH